MLMFGATGGPGEGFYGTKAFNRELNAVNTGPFGLSTSCFGKFCVSKRVVRPL